jgi:hypothetical protein
MRVAYGTCSMGGEMRNAYKIGQKTRREAMEYGCANQSTKSNNSPTGNTEVLFS